MTAFALTFRAAGSSDLDAVNTLIERAVMTWDLPERVKRLALSSYHYHQHDLEHLQLLLAECGQTLCGVAAWERADAGTAPPGATALLLHGIYVDPERHGRGIGTQLLQAAAAAVRERHLDGIVVKAQPGAEAFFLARGFAPVPVQNPGRDYAHRLWKPL